MKTKLTPILQDLVKPTDTEAIIEKAIELANLHTHYKADCQFARFCNFYTEAEVKKDARPSHPYIRVSENSVYSTHRFERALQAARVGK